jgi:hypothetical protein
MARGTDLNTRTSTVTLTPAASTVTDHITLLVSTTTLSALTITTTISATEKTVNVFLALFKRWLDCAELPLNVPYFAWTLEYGLSNIDINLLLVECIQRYHAYFGISEPQLALSKKQETNINLGL